MSVVPLRTRLHVVGMLRFTSDINQPNSLFLCLCLFGPFNCISFHKFKLHLSVFSLCSSGVSSTLLVLSTIYLFTKVSFSPDIMPSGLLGSKQKLTNRRGYGRGGLRLSYTVTNRTERWAQLCCFDVSEAGSWGSEQPEKHHNF